MNEKDRLDSLFIFTGIICFIFYMGVNIRVYISGVSINFSDVFPCIIATFTSFLILGVTIDILDAIGVFSDSSADRSGEGYSHYSI